ncbi:unnamed protein product [Adineta steineri]|uniref:Uncharacterized protein n=2 Tax=Adineta steineri TaxID=433720 RepID=A0A814B4L1_9BILA|nr:unnamed protein product [Adineta steineri]
MHQYTLLILFIAIIQFNCACFITNCPIGGKRSLHLINNLQNHQCPRCGLTGQCFGPAICCTDLACRIGHPSDIRQCSAEDHNLTPCIIKSPTCSTVPNGRCAANGICCGTESCQIDETCSIASNQEINISQEERL